MERWICNPVNDFREVSRVEAFMKELKALCAKHDLVISHEDGQGSFIIDKLTPGGWKWLNEADVAPVVLEPVDK